MRHWHWELRECVRAHVHKKCWPMWEMPNAETIDELIDSNPLCRLFFKIDLLTDIAALCLTIFCRSFTLCFWPGSEPTKLLHHPKQKWPVKTTLRDLCLRSSFVYGRMDKERIARIGSYGPESHLGIPCSHVTAKKFTTIPECVNKNTTMKYRRVLLFLKISPHSYCWFEYSFLTAHIV